MGTMCVVGFMIEEETISFAEDMVCSAGSSSSSAFPSPFTSGSSMESGFMPADVVWGEPVPDCVYEWHDMVTVRPLVWRYYGH